MADEIKKEQKYWKKFQKIMKMPLCGIPQNDLEWAAQQDSFNSFTSKQIFLEEIKRRKNGEEIL